MSASSNRSWQSGDDIESLAAAASGDQPSDLLNRSGLAGSMLDIGPRRVIFHQGDSADSVYLIHCGTVKLTVVSDDGKEATVALLGSGDLLGEACITGKVSDRISTAQTVTKCRLLRVSRASMAQVIHKDPQFLDYFLSFVVSRNLKMQDDLLAQLFTSSEKRLARTLLMLAGFGHDHAEQAHVQRMSHEELAEIVGTTRSRISYFMNRFRRQGHIDYSGITGELVINHSLISIAHGLPACQLCPRRDKAAS
ncbi:MAG TPA: Crp/Fnr family transcriptional regulator [Candidatus Limnocylindrales bacterium]|jgi:CRP-like cAMP-binding protein|nr:Crp/Fnr family transcriptional regulator [Candidatus Limnocylindrales bacterium]